MLFQWDIKYVGWSQTPIGKNPAGVFAVATLAAMSCATRFGLRRDAACTAG